MCLTIDVLYFWKRPSRDCRERYRDALTCSALCTNRGQKRSQCCSTEKTIADFLDGQCEQHKRMKCGQKNVMCLRATRLNDLYENMLRFITSLLSIKTDSITKTESADRHRSIGDFNSFPCREYCVTHLIVPKRSTVVLKCLKTLEIQ